MSIQDTAKELNRIVKKYNPLDNEVELKNGTLSWKIDPKIEFDETPFSDIDRTKFDVEVKKNLSENIQVNLKVKSDLNFSDMKDFNAKLEFKIKLK